MSSWNVKKNPPPARHTECERRNWRRWEQVSSADNETRKQPDRPFANHAVPRQLPSTLAGNRTRQLPEQRPELQTFRYPGVCRPVCDRTTHLSTERHRPLEPRRPTHFLDETEPLAGKPDPAAADCPEVPAASSARHPMSRPAAVVPELPAA